MVVNLLSSRSEKAIPPPAQVAYLGPPGTYSHEITRRRFSEPEYELVPYGSIREAIYSLVPRKGKQRASWAVVPTRNSSFGPVLETQQVLSEPQVIHHTHTLDEQLRLKIEHCLVGKKSCREPARCRSLTPVEDHSIQKVLSHVQALGQCQEYIASHYPKAQLVETASTVAAATFVANDATCTSLAICPSACIKYLPELEVLDSNIQDAGTENFTTFIILERSD